MNISNRIWWQFVWQCLLAGTFAVLSLACFSMVYFFTTPETERLVKAFKSETLYQWLLANFGGLDLLWASLMFIGATVAASLIGFITGIVASALYDRAKKTFERGLVS